MHTIYFCDSRKRNVLPLLSFFGPLDLLAFPLCVLLRVRYSQFDTLLTTFQSLGLCSLSQFLPFSRESCSASLFLNKIANLRCESSQIIYA